MTSSPSLPVPRLVRRAARLPATVLLGCAEATLGLLAPVVGGLADRVARRIDLTPLVKEIVDLDALISTVDLDAVVERLDLDAVAGRLDLAALVETVLAEIDLPEIIRSSTGSVASTTVRGLRMQSILADEAVTRAYDRLRGRRAGTQVVGPPTADGVGT